MEAHHDGTFLTKAQDKYITYKYVFEKEDIFQEKVQIYGDKRKHRRFKDIGNFSTTFLAWNNLEKKENGSEHNERECVACFGHKDCQIKKAATNKNIELQDHRRV